MGETRVKKANQMDWGWGEGVWWMVGFYSSPCLWRGEKEPPFSLYNFNIYSSFSLSLPLSLSLSPSLLPNQSATVAQPRPFVQSYQLLNFFQIGVITPNQKKKKKKRGFGFWFWVWFWFFLPLGNGNSGCWKVMGTGWNSMPEFRCLEGKWPRDPPSRPRSIKVLVATISNLHFFFFLVGIVCSEVLVLGLVWSKPKCGFVLFFLWVSNLEK